MTVSRQQILNSLTNNPKLSVLIVGAGINGVGTFRDLALQGIDVLLIDKNDFCSGASAASSHMVHGGIRYLENGEFRLVREAVQERNRLIMNAPQYVKPLATTIPIFQWSSGLFNAPLKFLGLLDKPTERGALVIKAGLMMYDAYTKEQGTVPQHEFDFRQKALKRHPKLNPEILCTATYYDAAMNSPERICVELITDAERASLEAKALNYVSVESASGGFVRLKDELSGERFDVQPQIVINAAGPWIDFANQALGQQTLFIGGTKGSHLVLDHPELFEAVGGREFFFENYDGRIVLIYPLMDKVLIGTSDIRTDEPDEVRCTEEEIDYFFGMINKVFPSIQVDNSHIVFSFAGVRPLPASEANSTGQISRDHSTRIIEPDASTHDLSFPIYSLIGGKWTTFRAFSESVADQILARLGKNRQVGTQELAIGGGKSYPYKESERQQWIHKQQIETILSRERIKILFNRYGTGATQIIDYIQDQTVNHERPDQPLANHGEYSYHEVAFIVENEKVVHLDDFILRRSLLGMLGELTIGLLNELAQIIGERLNWSEQDRQEELSRTKRLLAEKHGVQLSTL